MQKLEISKAVYFALGRFRESGELVPRLILRAVNHGKGILPRLNYTLRKQRARACQRVHQRLLIWNTSGKKSRGASCALKCI